MSTVTRPELQVRIDPSAKRLLDGLPKPKILVTVESTIYFGCCGGYEEKGLKVEAVEEIKDASDFILLSGEPPIYVQRGAFELLQSRGNRFTIYADLNGRLYSDQ